jgi:hypothetical protein
MTTTNQSPASNVSIISATSEISIQMSSLQGIDLEFDFELCHTQYSYCSCWH